MNFKAEFIQICFRYTADFLQPSFHLGWSVSINRALLCLFFDLVTFWMHMPVWFTSTIELKIKLLSPSLSAVPFSSCSRSWYSEIATRSFPTSQASCRVSFPPCCSHAEVARIPFTLIFPDLCLEGQNLSSHSDLFRFSYWDQVLFFLCLQDWEFDWLIGCLVGVIFFFFFLGIFDALFLYFMLINENKM